MGFSINGAGNWPDVINNWAGFGLIGDYEIL